MQFSKIHDIPLKAGVLLTSTNVTTLWFTWAMHEFGSNCSVKDKLSKLSFPVFLSKDPTFVVRKKPEHCLTMSSSHRQQLHFCYYYYHHQQETIISDIEGSIHVNLNKSVFYVSTLNISSLLSCACICMANHPTRQTDSWFVQVYMDWARNTCE